MVVHILELRRRNFNAILPVASPCHAHNDMVFGLRGDLSSRFEVLPAAIASAFAGRNFKLAITNVSTAGTGRAGLGHVLLANRLITVVTSRDVFDLLVDPFLLFVAVVDFLPLEAGIPTLARAVRFVPPFSFLCHLTNFSRLPFCSATARVCAQMKYAR